MIFLAYGQPKSASTFLTRLAIAAVGVSGSDSVAIKSRLFTGALARQRSFWSGPLEPLSAVAHRLAADEHIVVKTHSPFADGLRPAIEDGRIRVLISYRHIGDAALSAFEAGERARERGETQQGFYALRSHRAAIDYIGMHFRTNTLPWLRAGVGTAFSYSQLTAAPGQVIAHLADLLGVDRETQTQAPEIRRLLSGEERVYNFNKGVSGRYLDAFSPADLDYLETRYGRLNRFCEGQLALENI